MSITKIFSERVGVFQKDDDCTLGLIYRVETQEETKTQDFECQLTPELWEKVKKCARHFFKVATAEVTVVITICGEKFDLCVRNKKGSNKLCLALVKDGVDMKIFSKHFSVEEWLKLIGTVERAFQEMH